MTEYSHSFVPDVETRAVNHGSRTPPVSTWGREVVTHWIASFTLPMAVGLCAYVVEPFKLSPAAILAVSGITVAAAVLTRPAPRNCRTGDQSHPLVEFSFRASLIGATLLGVLWLGFTIGKNAPAHNSTPVSVEPIRTTPEGFLHQQGGPFRKLMHGNIRLAIFAREQVSNSLNVHALYPDRLPENVRNLSLSTSELSTKDARGVAGYAAMKCIAVKDQDLISGGTKPYAYQLCAGQLRDRSILCLPICRSEAGMKVVVGVFVVSSTMPNQISDEVVARAKLATIRLEADTRALPSPSHGNRSSTGETHPVEAHTGTAK